MLALTSCCQLDLEDVRQEAVTAGAGERATLSLAWVRFEADGSSPGAVMLDLRDSAAGRRRCDPGRGDFHGRWLDWRGLGA